jgi:hypothetical protein
VTLVLTSIKTDKPDGLAPGAKLTAPKIKRLKLGAAVKRGAIDWYFRAGGTSTAVFTVKHGRIQEVGIAKRALTATASGQVHFVAGLGKAAGTA